MKEGKYRAEITKEMGLNQRDEINSKSWSDSKSGGRGVSKSKTSNVQLTFSMNFDDESEFAKMPRMYEKLRKEIVDTGKMMAEDGEALLALHVQESNASGVQEGGESGIEVTEEKQPLCPKCKTRTCNKKRKGEGYFELCYECGLEEKNKEEKK